GKMLFYQKEFSQRFMPSAVFPYYEMESYRYIPDIHRLHQKFYTLSDSADIQLSQLVPPPQLHEVYLKGIGVQAALFFPLFMNGEFCGLVVAHNEKPKKVDLQKRKLCSFIVHNAMSKYENLVKQGLLDLNQQILQT